jgi:hypothetical protein
MTMVMMMKYVKKFDPEIRRHFRWNYRDLKIGLFLAQRLREVTTDVLRSAHLTPYG